MTPWIGWSLGMLAAILACGFASYVTSGLIGLPRTVAAWKRPAILTLLCLLPIAAETGIQTWLLTPDLPVKLTSGKVTALIYREPYQYQDEVGSEEAPEGWYLKIGAEPPQSVATAVSDFQIDQQNPTVVAYSGNPGATLRASVENMTERPQQVCTGDCDGLAAIASNNLQTTPGVIIADADRVQGSKLGDPAMSAEDGTTTYPLSTGHWCLAIGLGMTIIILVDHLRKRRLAGLGNLFGRLSSSRKPPVKTARSAPNGIQIVAMKKSTLKQARGEKTST